MIIDLREEGKKEGPVGTSSTSNVTFTKKQKKMASTKKKIEGFVRKVMTVGGEEN